MVEQMHIPDGCQVIPLYRNVSGDNFRPIYEIVGYTVVDDADFQWLSQHRWFMLENRNGDHYAKRVEWQRGKLVNIFMSREILGLPRGAGCGGDEADHFDHNTLNNRRENLRIVTPYQNMAHRRGWSSCRMPKGVRKNGQKYAAKIGVNGLTICFTSVSIKIEAALMFNYSAYLIHGENAELNVIPEDEMPSVERQWELYDMVIEKMREYGFSI